MISPGGISRNQNKKFQKNILNSTHYKECKEEDIIFVVLFLLKFVKLHNWSKHNY